MAKKEKMFFVVDEQGWYLERTDLGYWFNPDIKKAKKYTEVEADECVNHIKSETLKKIAA